MVKFHLKRLNTPATWPLARKENVFITRPNPGYKREMCLPINNVLKNVLGKTQTTKESKFILTHQEVLVNGKRRKDYRYPVGFLSVLSLTAAKEHYRLTVNNKGKLVFKAEKPTLSTTIPQKLVGKTSLKKGIVQLNFFDGSNLRCDEKSYKVNDTLLIQEGKKIIEHLPFEKGALIFLIGGSHKGTLGACENIDDKTVTLKVENKQIETHKRYAYVVGKKGAKEPVVTV